MAKNSERFVPNRKQRNIAAGHLLYEVEQMANCARSATEDTSGEVHATDLECCLLHVRNLTYFLCMPPKKSTDMVAADFVPNWTARPEAAADELRESMPSIHQHLAHLTWQRVTWSEDPHAEPSPRWLPVRLSSLVLDVFGAFQDDYGKFDAGLPGLRSLMPDAGALGLTTTSTNGPPVTTANFGPWPKPDTA